jgi:hypothetical protein
VQILHPTILRLLCPLSRIGGLIPEDRIMATIRAKFYVTEKTLASYQPGKDAVGGRVKLTPVRYDHKNPESENSRFWTASPSGELTMQIQNQAAFDAFKIGQSYLVDFTPVE